MKKQSSIDWLEEKLKPYIMLEKSKANEIIEQAKEMHKEEMIDFANDLLAQNDKNYIALPDLAEQYYNQNQTFNN